MNKGTSTRARTGDVLITTGAMTTTPSASAYILGSEQEETFERRSGGITGGPGTITTRLRSSVTCLKLASSEEILEVFVSPLQVRRYSGGLQTCWIDPG